MKSTFTQSLIVASLLLGGGVSFAQYQNSDNAPPRPRQNFNRQQRMTPEQRRQQMEQRQQQAAIRLRSIMTENGLTNSNDQDAILTYLSEESEARRPLRQMGMKLQEALNDPAVTDVQLKGLINDYENAQKIETKQRAKAQAELDDKIHYSKNPRTEGLLILMGVLGNGPSIIRSQHPSPRQGQNRGGRDGKFGDNGQNDNGQRRGQWNRNNQDNTQNNEDEDDDM